MNLIVSALNFSKSIETSIKHFAGSYDLEGILEGAEQVFAENDCSMTKAIEALDRRKEELDPCSEEYDLCALQKLALKMVSEQTGLSM